MDLINNKSSIDIITGPMFSGKTTELLRRLTILKEAGLNVLYITSTLDTREFISHNKGIGKPDMAFCSTHTLMSTRSYSAVFNVIGIDEAQFFDDLPEFCIEMSEKYGSKVIVAGLNSDFRREKFGKICELLPICDNITKLYPFCASCAKNRVLTPALFSKRKIISEEKVVIGDCHSYLPVCRDCYKT